MYRGRSRGQSTQGTLSSRQRRFEDQLERKFESQTKGRVFRPSTMPALFNAQPWNTAVIRLIITVSTAWFTLKAKDLAKSVCNQLGLYYTVSGASNNINIEFRVHSVSAWSKAQDTYLRLLPLDLIMVRDKPTESRELTNVDCMAQRNMYATGGYIWPISHQEIVFQSGDAGYLLALESSVSSEVEVHMKISWRGADAALLKKVYAYQTISKRPRIFSDTASQLDEASNAPGPSDPQPNDEDDLVSLLSDIDLGPTRIKETEVRGHAE